MPVPMMRMVEIYELLCWACRRVQQLRAVDGNHKCPNCGESLAVRWLGGRNAIANSSPITKRGRNLAA